MKKLRSTERFDRQFKALPKRLQPGEFNLDTFEYVIELLMAGEPVPPALRPHRLEKRTVNWAGLMECHLGLDWLMIYAEHDAEVVLIATGTHADLFTPRKRAGE